MNARYLKDVRSKIGRDLADLEERIKNPPLSGCPRDLIAEYVAALEEQRELLLTRCELINRDIERMSQE